MKFPARIQNLRHRLPAVAAAQSLPNDFDDPALSVDTSRVLLHPRNQLQPVKDRSADG
jgi:hypothetical protein